MFASTERVIAAIRAGDMVVIVDDEDRENEGDFIIAADHVDANVLTFMATHGRGLICCPLSEDRLDHLGIPSAVSAQPRDLETAFTASVDLAATRSTGGSAAERAACIRRLIDPAATHADFRSPGHVFPLRAKRGGVLRRPGHTEAAVDLADLAGLQPAGVICEIMSPDGSMARLPELRKLAEKHSLLLSSIAQLIEYRRRTEKLVHRVVESGIETEYGFFRVVGYESVVDGSQHLALLAGHPEGKSDVLVRVHSECLTGDAFTSRHCDCGQQLKEAMRVIAREGEGAVVYLRGHEGRGIGIMNKLAAYNLQAQGRDTVEANVELGLPVDGRDYGIGAQILADLGLSSLRLLTNNPTKRAALSGFGLEVIERVPLRVGTFPQSRAYLATKREKLGHML